MAADVRFQYHDGVSVQPLPAGGVLKYKRAPDNRDDLNDPLIRPLATGGAPSFEYSYEKVLRPYVAGGTFTQMTSLRVRSTAMIIQQGGGDAHVSLHYRWAANGPGMGQDPQLVDSLTAFHSLGYQDSLIIDNSPSGMSWSNAGVHGTVSGTGVPWNGADWIFSTMRVSDGVGGPLEEFDLVLLWSEV
jgi:hypothetical protein